MRFRVEMARLHNEALSAAMALDPDLEYNTKEVADKATSELQKRQDLYIKKLEACLEQLASLQSRISLQVAADTPINTRPMSKPKEVTEVRYTAREGGAGLLPDSIDPAGMLYWLDRHYDHTAACLGGAIPTARQLLVQAKLQLEPGWRDLSLIHI